MARDRLAAMRAQQGGGSYTSENSAPSQPSGGGYSSRRPNPYAQQDDPSYEMSEVQNSRANLVGNDGYGGGGAGYGDGGRGYTGSGGGGGGDMPAFYDEITAIQDSIRAYNDNVARIGDLHSRSLNNMDEMAAQRNQQQLDQLIDDTSAMAQDLKQRIKALQKQGGAGRDGQIRKQQTGLVKTKFVEAIQNYQTVEQQYRQRSKQRMERQYKIVNPNATPDEVRAVVNDDAGGQIFSQALMNSNRQGESRAAYREVQERHADIQRIERTLGELAQLFNDMSILVEQQDEQINTIEATTGNVEMDVETGVVHLEKGVESARGARQKRWILFWIVLVLVIIIAIIIVVKVVLPAINNNKKSN